MNAIEYTRTASAVGASLQVDEKFSREIHQQMRPIIQLFTPFFFVMAGLSLDLQTVDWSSGFIWIFSISLTAVAVISKLAEPWFTREDISSRIAIGMAMVPRGEVGLVFAELGRLANIFTPSVSAVLLIVIAYTTLFSLFWI